MFVTVMMIMKQRYNIMVSPRDMDLLAKAAFDLCTSRSEIIGKLIREYCIDNNLYTRYLVNEKIEGQVDLLEGDSSE